MFKQILLFICKFSHFIVLYLFKLFTFIIKLHYSTLVCQFEPIKTVEHRSSSCRIAKAPPSQINHLYLLHLIEYLGTCIYGMLILPLHFHCCTSLSHQLASLTTNPHTIPHLIFPQALWPVSDPIEYVTMALVLVVLFLLSQIKRMPTKYEFNSKNHLLSYKGRVLDRHLSDQMFTTTTRHLRLTNRISVFYHLLMDIIWSFNILLLICDWHPSLILLCFLLFIFPLYLLYICFVLLYLGAHLTLASKLLQLQQRSLIDKLKHLTVLIVDSKLNAKLFSKYYRKFTQLNANLLGLCQAIQSTSSFWNPLLSALYPYYIFVQTFIAYGLLFMKLDLFIEWFVLLYGLFAVTIVFAFLIDRCAQVARLNGRIEGGCGRFNFAVQQCGQASVVHLIKLEIHSTSRRLRQYSFCVIGSYRITQRTAYFIAYQIIGLFLTIFRHF